MEVKVKWLKEDKNIVAPKTLDSQVFDSNGTPISQIIKDIKKSDYHVYSTEEKVVGEIDGKLVYEKSYKVASMPASAMAQEYDIGIVDIDSIVDYSALLDLGSIVVKAPHIDQSSAENMAKNAIHARFTKLGKLSIVVGANRSNNSCYGWVRYTKTTDTLSLAETALNDE